MTINARVEAALAGIGCIVGFQQLDDGAYINTFPSVTYFSYLDQPEGWADDVAHETAYFIQIDVWSKTNYLTLVTNIISAMRAADFGYLDGRDLLEAEGTIYHKALRFKYSEFI